MARYVLDGDGRERRDLFRMRKWFDDEDFRRERYFTQLDGILASLRQGSVDPPDSSVVSMLAIMLDLDDSLTDHCLKQGIVGHDRKAILETGAAMILSSTYALRRTVRGPRREADSPG